MSAVNGWNGLPVVIFGCGGAAKEVKAIIDDINDSCNTMPFDLLGYVSENDEIAGEEIEGARVVCGEERFGEFSEGFAVIGVVIPFENHEIKRKIHKKLQAFSNIVFPTIIHPSVSISRSLSTHLGVGVILCANVILTTNIHMGDFVYVNKASVIGHDCVIGDFTTVSVGACISGSCTIGEDCLIGSNVSIKQGLTVGNGAVCGMGAAVFVDVPAGATVISDIARRIK